MAAPKRTGSKSSSFSFTTSIAASAPPPIGWHTVEEVAKRYHRKPEAIRAWLRSGYLPGSIIGNRWLISDAQIAAFEATK